MQNYFYSWIQQMGWIQTLTTGVFLGIGFVIPSLWFLSIFAVIYILRIVQLEQSCKKIVYVISFIWFIKSLLSISWFWSAYPIDWVEGMSSSVQMTLISTYWLTSSIWLCSGGALFAFVSVWLLQKLKLSKSAYLCAAPCLWLVAELFSALVFSLCTAGPGSFLQTYFSFGMVGYLLGVTDFGVWFAAIGGVYGLTVLHIFLAVLGFFLLSRVSKKIGILMMCILYLLLSGIQSNVRLVSKHPISVIAIDTQFDAEFLSTPSGSDLKAKTLDTAVATAVKKQPDVILLPEDSRYLSAHYNPLYPNQAMSQFQFIHGNTNSILIDSGRYTTEAGLTVVRANIFDGLSKKMWQIDKQYLVPQGEYVPTMYGTVLKVLGYGSVVNAVAEDSAYRPGPLLQTSELPTYVPGVLFCFESVSPRAGKDLIQTRNDMPFITHPISHAWFHTPTILWQQLDVMLQIQARYSGLPIVSAGNMATGKLYLPNGVIELGKVVGSGDKYQLREFRF